MLKSLHIRNYALIDSLDIDFPEGLSIITGQTGAGKSILLGALSLVLGSKADPSVAAGSTGNCIVEACFDASRADSRLKDMVDDAGLDWNGGDLVLRRVLSSSGRSRAFLGDEPVNLPLLTAMAGFLVDIHGQNTTSLLTDSAWQLSVLDSFASNDSLRSRYKAAYSERNSLKRALEEAESSLRKSRLEADFNRALYDKLAQARLRDGELEELEAEQRTLANASQIKEGLYEALGSLSGGEDGAFDRVLKEVSKKTDKLSRFLPDLESVSGRVESLRLEMDDIIAELTAASERVEVSPSRLEAVEARMSEIYSLLTKHSCTTVAQLIGLRDALATELQGAEGLEERIDELNKRLEIKNEEISRLAGELSESRKQASEVISAEVTRTLEQLELERAVFEAGLKPAPEGPDGADEALFLFSANGAAPANLSKCSSGGERSRIMLALKAALARKASLPTMIFDEIDTGVSGSAADKMGGLICSMGAHMQLVAITHLPQVAAKGGAHFLVTKTRGEGEGVKTEMSQISGEDRVMEIARMLSASDITPEAVANARALLAQAV